MKQISHVLRGMSLSDHVSAAEQADRERRANERQARLEAEAIQRQVTAAAIEQDEIVRQGRPEYKSAKNAKARNKRYQKHVRFAEYEQSLAEKRNAVRVAKMETEA